MRISEDTKRENRKRILALSTELFKEKGYEATTTRDIAKAADMATGTLFNYFPSKESLVMHMAALELDKGFSQYQKIKTHEESLIEDLFLFISSGLRSLREMHSYLGPVFEKSLSPFPRRNICPEGEQVRFKHLAHIQKITTLHGFSTSADHVALTIYWSLYLGILSFWVNDQSPNQEETTALIDYSLQVFVNSISGGSL